VDPYLHSLSGMFGTALPFPYLKWNSDLPARSSTQYLTAITKRQFKNCRLLRVENIPISDPVSTSLPLNHCHTRHTTPLFNIVTSRYTQVALEMRALSNRATQQPLSPKKRATGYLTLIKISYDRITENRVVY
jgi:hypothetical protein